MKRYPFIKVLFSLIVILCAYELMPAFQLLAVFGLLVIIVLGLVARWLFHRKTSDIRQPIKTSKET